MTEENRNKALTDDFKTGWDAYDHGDYATILRIAEQGDAEAQNLLGIMYSNGEGVAQDYVEAVRWWRLAAKQGDAQGQFNLGVMYDLGFGVEQDYVQANHWFRLAAKQGNAGEKGVRL